MDHVDHWLVHAVLCIQRIVSRDGATQTAQDPALRADAKLKNQTTAKPRRVARRGKAGESERGGPTPSLLGLGLRLRASRPRPAAVAGVQGDALSDPRRDSDLSVISVTPRSVLKRTQ